MSETCGECRYYEAVMAQCRRNPPRTDVPHWPWALPQHWCGEFKSRIPKFVKSVLPHDGKVRWILNKDWVLAQTKDVPKENDDD